MDTLTQSMIGRKTDQQEIRLERANRGREVGGWEKRAVKTKQTRERQLYLYLIHAELQIAPFLLILNIGL